jgi:hypothetical protein
MLNGVSLLRQGQWACFTKIIAARFLSGAVATDNGQV